MDSKSLVDCFVRNHQYFEIFGEKKRGKMGCLREFYHRFMYIAPSSDCSLLTFSLPF